MPQLYVRSEARRHCVKFTQFGVKFTLLRQNFTHIPSETELARFLFIVYQHIKRRAE